MLLRASGEVQGGSVEVSLVTASAEQLKTLSHGDDKVADAARLLCFADATVTGTAEDILQSGRRVREALGDEAWIRAACIVGNFQRMNRVADATGVSLDGPMQFVSSDIRKELGADAYASAAGTSRGSRWSALLGPWLRPWIMRVASFGASMFSRRKV